MKGDLGPYVNDDGDIWVPRTVSFRQAREIARECLDSDQYPKYGGKTQSRLIGFARDCPCEEVCCLRDTEADDFDPDLADVCVVPAWFFTATERRS